jgi:murein DD-endopeptidase MepM/ murein hydrolase activator NlpD
MRNTIYRYNSQTCQYERVKVNAKNVLWYSLAVTVTAACMLFGILLLHDIVINTDVEKKLRKENAALKRYHTTLSVELNELKPVLTSLQNKDKILHAKFFGSSQPSAAHHEDKRAPKEKLLLADATSFPELVSSIRENSQELIEKSSSSNHYFGKKLSLTEEYRSLINSWPALPPVSPWQGERLISGFGMRVNPFHKGLYEHLGIDVAVPRGTTVIATGSGVVRQLKRSDLQAGYGNYIEIDHGLGVVTRYAHLEDIHVKFGAKIQKGEAVGTVGTSGGSIAPHLHYEVLRDGRNVDPVLYIVEGVSSEEHHQLVAISHQQNQSLD